MKPHARILTATAIFDGHDASINIIRRVLQDHGAEIIHLGHNHSVDDIVNAAIQEDVNAIALSSYQGGHIEFFHYLIDCLNKIAGENNTESAIKVFGGGGGTITESEAQALQQYGVARVFSSKEGAALGLEGMARYILECCHQQAKRVPLPKSQNLSKLDMQMLAKTISVIEQEQANADNQSVREAHPPQKKTRRAKVIGITGTGGSGKSTIIDELLKSLLADEKSLRIAYLAIDPTRKKSGGALLGDRIRINCQYHSRLFMRSMATRKANVAINPVLEQLISLLDSQDFDLILVETAGIGQSDSNVVDFVDESIYVMTKDYGAPTQLEKIEMLDYADIVILNKCDQQGSEDAFHSVCKQWQSNHQRSETTDKSANIFPMVASQFNDVGLKNFINQIQYNLGLCKEVRQAKYSWKQHVNQIIPDRRRNYLADIATQASDLQRQHKKQIANLNGIASYYRSLKDLGDKNLPVMFENYKTITAVDKTLDRLRRKYNDSLASLDKESIELLKNWPERYKSLNTDSAENRNSSHTSANDQSNFQYNFKKTISQLALPLVATPEYNNSADLLEFLLNENIPGEFPFTAGVFPYRNTVEAPTRMFAGEGTPEDTNRRFFYLFSGQSTRRLSTAFDPITLYGKDPDSKPDVYGCIGMSGVSVACLDDMKKLYSGIDLCDKHTSVSMTINGPAAILLAWFFNVAIDQQVEKHLKNTGAWSQAEKTINNIFTGKERPAYHGELPEQHNGLGLATLGVSGQQLLDEQTYTRIKLDALKKIRGTLQADILKEELAQNECIFSLSFGLQLMGDIQEYFIANNVKRFYSVSVSGYHIAEAGANPITQLAFTLANGFTLVEYYLARGMHIDDFASQFSFFFSNGMDPEYAVIGRVARRIWARAMRYHYGANHRSQKLKYHIQTSGRSLQAENIELNDIRTTLQAIYAIFDNCNSLHTNAYDEAVTTPTEESVQRALAIQMIINREYGLTANQNPLQGSFFIKQLTDLVEQAIYGEFDRLSERGGVLGAIETFYQRNKIQQESLTHEQQKSDGSLPIVGVNTFVFNNKDQNPEHRQLIRSSAEKKQQQIDGLELFKRNNTEYSQKALQRLSITIDSGENSFNCLMDICQVCSLGQITAVLTLTGGQFRRKV